MFTMKHPSNTRSTLKRTIVRRNARHNLIKTFQTFAAMRNTGTSMQQTFQEQFRRHLQREYNENISPNHAAQTRPTSIVAQTFGDCSPGMTPSQMSSKGYKVGNNSQLASCFRTPTSMETSAYSGSGTGCSDARSIDSQSSANDSIRMTFRQPPSQLVSTSMPTLQILWPQHTLIREQLSGGAGLQQQHGNLINTEDDANFDNDSMCSDVDDEGVDGDDEATPKTTPNKGLTAQQQHHQMDQQQHVFSKNVHHTNYNQQNSTAATTTTRRRQRIVTQIPEAMSVIKMSTGRYLHCGIARTVDRYTTEWPSDRLVQLTVAVYVLQLSDISIASSKRHIILMGRAKSPVIIMPTTMPMTEEASMQRQQPLNTVAFPLGVYEGTFNDGPIGNEIFAPFVSEMQHLEQHGFWRENHGMPTAAQEQPMRRSRIIMRAFVCDPIAAALLSCCVLPTNTRGCIKCSVVGKLTTFPGGTIHIKHVAPVTYPAIAPDELRRVDDDFRKVLDGRFHLARPLIDRLATAGVCSSVVLDYKHTICGGVMRRLWMLWTCGKLEHRLNKKTLERITLHLDEFAKNLPRDVRHGPKSLADWENWTPYDWRQFLLFYGPVVLAQTLPNYMYTHFLSLYLGTRMMIGDRAVLNASIIGFLLRRFVGDFVLIYGEGQVDYNIHALLHVEDAVKTFGPMDDISGFGYDSLLNTMIHGLQLGNNIEARGESNEAVDLSMSSDERITMDNKFVLRPERSLEYLRNAILQEEAMFDAGMMPARPNEPIRFTGIDYALPFADYSVNYTQSDNYVTSPRGVLQVCFIQMYHTGAVQMVARRYRTGALMYDSPSQFNGYSTVPTNWGAMMIPDLNEQFEVFDLFDTTIQMSKVSSMLETLARALHQAR